MSNKVLCVAMALVAAVVAFCPGLLLAAEAGSIDMSNLPSYDWTTAGKTIMTEITTVIGAAIGIGLTVWAVIYMVRVFRRAAG